MKDVLSAVVRTLLGTSNEAKLRAYRPLLAQVTTLEPTLVALNDSQLRQKSATLREQLHQDPSLTKALRGEVFALVREVADRRIGMWNAIAGKKVNGDPVPPFPQDAWGSARSEVEQVRARLAAGEAMWDIDCSAAVYAAIRSHSPISAPPYRMRAHDVQIIGGAILFDGCVAEMKTGEGKTLVASFAAALEGMTGRGVHIITVNDYLARRDAAWNEPTYRFLGLVVAAIQHDQHPGLRREIYQADITYGTNNEFGFDYLRDNLKQRKEEQVQTRRNYAIVDEVDSVLIDEARTPLIISGPAVGRAQFYQQADHVAAQLEKGAHFEIDLKDRTVTLTDDGIGRACELFGVQNLYDDTNMHLPHFLDNALKARHLYNKDKEYLLHQGRVVIVDEFTGRMMVGRRWSDGLHQAVETKEGVQVEEETQTYATITLQNFFRMYQRLAGMTGTALTEAAEFNDIYKLDVISVPTNVPVVRRDLPDLIYGTGKEKYEAIALEVADLYAVGQPVLVGTISVEVSELLSELFTRKGIKHNVLNARQHQREAEIVSQAGHLGAVTIATNMAGRGTDIVLGQIPFAELLAHWQAQGLAPKRMEVGNSQLDAACVDIWSKKWCDEKSHERSVGFEPAARLELVNQARYKQGLAPLPLPSGLPSIVHVRQLGGLRIIGTERHESRRIDNQLRGRSGRQGDPGSSRFYLSLDDDLMKRFAGPTMANLMRSMGLKDGVPIESRMVSRNVEKAQKRVEEFHYGIRKNLLEYDQVNNLQRSQIYSWRQRMLEGEKLESFLLETLEQGVDEVVQGAASDGTRGPDLAVRIAKAFAEASGLPSLSEGDIPVAQGGDACRSALMAVVKRQVADRALAWGPLYEQVLRFVLLETLDRRWREHLYQMDHLRHAIGLEGYGQRDPKMRYKEEGFRLFMAMLSLIRADVLRLFFRLQVQMEPARDEQAQQAVEQQASREALSAPEAMLQAGGFVPRQKIETSRMVASGPLGPRNQPGPEDPCPCGSGAPYRHCHGIV